MLLYVSHNKTTIKELKPVLNSYNLPVSGNRQQLIERLSSFASKREDWTGFANVHVTVLQDWRA